MISLSLYIYILLCTQERGSCLLSMTAIGGGIARKGSKFPSQLEARAHAHTHTHTSIILAKAPFHSLSSGGSSPPLLPKAEELAPNKPGGCDIVATPPPSKIVALATTT